MSEPFRPRTFGAVLADVSARLPDKRAVVFGDSAFTYSEVAQRVRTVARGLIALGVEPDAKVGIWLPNRIEWIALNLAAAAIGAVTVPVNMRYRTEEADYIIGQCDCDLLAMTDRVLQTDYYAMIREICPELERPRQGRLRSSRLPRLRHVLGLGGEQPPGVAPFSDLERLAAGVSDAQLDERMSAVSVNDICHIQYTSGTTARPKGAMHAHQTLLHDSHEICQAMRIGESDVIFSALPLYHIAGHTSAFLSAFQNGGTFVSSDHFDTAESLHLIQRERCTIIRGTETMFIMMMAHPEFDRYDLSSLRGGVCGSNAPDVLGAVYEKMGVRELTSVFGMSETASASTMTRVGDPLQARLETAGKPLPGIEVRIVDPETRQPLATGDRGEILIRGWNLMRGYYNKPAETAEAIDSEGWLHTGDLGLLDADANLHFIDRIKDVVRVGGENVSAAEVESFLFRHPKVQLVQIVAGPDPRLGQICVAYVKAKPGSDCTADEIIDFCRGKIASFKVPRHVFFVDEFPLTGSGKVQKFVLREMARREIEARTTA
jgi:fatty-acyl-CoA synthase